MIISYGVVVGTTIMSHVQVSNIHKEMVYLFTEKKQGLSALRNHYCDESRCYIFCRFVIITYGLHSWMITFSLAEQ